MSIRIARGIAGALAASAAYVGVWAVVAPHSFFTTFPGLGGAWLAFGAPHLAFHLGHRHGFSYVDWAASLTPLTLAALGAAMLVLLRGDVTAPARRRTALTGEEDR